MQLLKDEMGIPTRNTFGDQREAARAVGDFYADRYGGGQEILDTIRTDPAGAVLDALGVATGGAGVAARAPGMAGQVAKVVSQADPAMALKGIIPSTRKVTPKEFVEGAPSADQLGAASSRLYDEAAQAGITFPADDFTKFRGEAVAKLRNEGVDPILHPKVNRLVGILEEAEGAPDLQRMEILRRQFGDAASSTDAAERRLGQIGIELVDDFVESGSEASGTLRQARALWARKRKSEVIDKAIEDATLAKEGVEAGLRNQFTNLYRARDKKKMRGFTKDELKAIKAVAEGNMSSNIMRRIGSLSGGTGAQRNMLNALAGMGVGAGAGAAAGGPLGGAIGGVVVPLAGHGAQRLAQKATQGKADLARAMVARGETPGRVAKQTRVPYAPGMAPGLAAILAQQER